MAKDEFGCRGKSKLTAVFWNVQPTKSQIQGKKR